MKLADSLRASPITLKDGYPYIIHPIMDGVPRVDPRILQDWVDWAKQRVEMVQPTLLLAPEAMALPLVAALSLATGVPYVVARKRPYGLAGETKVEFSTGYSKGDLFVNDVGPEDRVIVVDDVYSTGGTMAAIRQALGDTMLGCLIAVDKSEHGIPDGEAMVRVSVHDGEILIE